MKRIIYTVFVLILLLNIQCTEKEYVDVDVNPQLEVLVLDIESNFVSGVTVKLFSTEEDLISKTGEIQSISTDSDGKAIFNELEEKIYYFYAEKGNLNNYFDVVTFLEPLSENQIKNVTCIIK
jgi:hypothetical protein